MSERPFTDEDMLRWVAAVQTQDAIRKYMEAMAQVLAEAGRASHKATGDSARAAVDKWCAVVRQRAMQILEESGDTRPIAKKMRELDAR